MAGHLDDWIAETAESITARLEGAKEAQRQTRFTLGMMAVISMMMLILSYNAYLSFDSSWVLARTTGSVLQNDQATTVADVLTQQALLDWAASRNAMIELLGIRVSVDDAPVLGTISLFVFSLWLLLVTRRENHTVGSLLRDTDTPHPDDESGGFGGSFIMSGAQDLYSNGQRWLIFHTIASNNLFVTFDRSMSRIQSLRGANRLLSAEVKGTKGITSRLGLAFARDFFFWFPVAASAFVFYLDRRSYFQPDPFAPGAAIPGVSAPLFFESMVVFFACWIPLLACCRGSAQYSRATDNVLRDYGQRLQSDLLRRESAGTPSPAAVTT
jgi:hypothetical protein